MTPASPTQETQAFKLIWRTWSPRKTVPCVWRLLKHCLPTSINLLRRGVSLPSVTCPLCAEEDEDLEHLFFRCKTSLSIGYTFLQWLGICLTPLSTSYTLRNVLGEARLKRWRLQSGLVLSGAYGICEMRCFSTVLRLYLIG